MPLLRIGSLDSARNPSISSPQDGSFTGVDRPSTRRRGRHGDDGNRSALQRCAAARSGATCFNAVPLSMLGRAWTMRAGI